MKKKWILLLLTVCLLIAAVTPTVLAAQDLFFVAVNDTIPLTLSSDFLPYYSGSVLYVPYQVFDSTPGGVVPAYNAAEQTFVLFTKDHRLIFELEKGTVTDEDNSVSEIQTTYKGGVLYVPASFCASHFGLRVAALTNSDGYMVLRFTNGSEVYDDQMFLEKAENLISYRISNHESGSAPEEADKQEQKKDEREKPPVQKEDPDQEVPQTEPITAYLAVTGADTMHSTLLCLRNARCGAAFFLTEEEIRQHGDLVRNLYAEGYPIGVTAAEDVTDVQEALRAANEALDDILNRKTFLALVSAAQSESLTGYSVFVKPDAAPSVADMLTVPGSGYLVPCSGDITWLLSELTQNKASISVLRETNRLRLSETE